MTVVEIRPVSEQGVPQDLESGLTPAQARARAPAGALKAQLSLLKLGDVIWGRVTRTPSPGKVLVRIGGQEFELSLSPPPSRGSELAFKVISAQPRLVLQMLSQKQSRKWAGRAGDRGPDGHGPSPPLQQGELVRGRLMELTSPRKGMVVLEGKRQEVYLVRPVPRGVDLTFRIIRTVPYLELAPAGEAEPGPETGFPLPETSYREPLSRAWQHMQAVLRDLLQDRQDSALASRAARVMHALQRLAYGQHTPPGTDFLRFFLRHSGLTLENALFRSLDNPVPAGEAQSLPADPLKSLLWELGLDLARTRDDKGRSPLYRKVLEATSRLAEALEHTQVLNHNTFPREGTLYLQIPFAFQGDFRTGYLSLKLGVRSGSRGKKPREMLVVFFLDLPRLGGVRVDAGLHGHNHIRISVYVEKEEVLSFVRQRLPLLAESLTARDMKVDYLEAMVVPRPKLEEACTWPDPASPHQGGLHVVV